MRDLLIFFFVCSNLAIFAQNSISGKVFDIKNQPLKGILVRAEQLNISTTTDQNGYYRINNLPQGNLVLSFSFYGYETVTEKKIINEDEIVLNITLSNTIVHMEDIIISNAFNKIQSQNVMKIEHETIKNLKQKGVTTLSEGLATIPGVSQISTGMSIGKPVIRGLSGNRVLVYSQGVRLENQQFGDEHGLGLNDEGIESVEVIKGPASLLYGSDALGGVLYFNPEKFADINSSKSHFNQRFFSNTLGTSTAIGYKSSAEKWKYLINSSFNAHSDYKIPDTRRVTNSRYNEADFKTAIGYNSSAFSSVFRYNYNQLNLGLPDSIGKQSKIKNPTFPKQKVDNHLLSLNNVLFFMNSKIEFNLGYIENIRSEFEENTVPNLKMNLKTFNYDIKYYFPKIGKFETIAGFQGMKQKNTNSGEEYLIPNANINDFGVFGISNYEWNSSAFQVGFRFDNRNVSTQTHGIENQENYFASIDKSFRSFNASAGYKTNFGNNFIFRTNVATGFRAPNLAELTSNGVHEGTNRYEIGNDNLKTEQNIQTDFNFEYKTSHFEFFLNLFYNHINNYIFITPTDTKIDDYFVYKYIQASSKLFGGEIGVHFHPHPLDWLHISSSLSNVTGVKNNGEYLPLIPANNWTNTMQTEFKSSSFVDKFFINANLSTTFSQNKVSSLETASAGYNLLNMGLGAEKKIKKANLEININVGNLFNKNYIPHLSRLKIDEIPNLGRNIIVGFNVVM